jgi:lysophospholipase L1-like esterase
MPGFERFRMRLQEKADRPAARPVTYVALGDSVTQGCMEEGIVEHERVYPQLLRKRIAERYPASLLNVINSGVAGDTAARSRERWDRDVIRCHPDLVTIMFGHNDAHGGEQGLADFIGAIGDLVSLVRAKTEADLLLITPIMMMKRDNPRISPKHRHFVPAFLKLHEEGHLRRYVEALRTFALDADLPLLDVYAMWEQMEQAGADIHERLANGINHPDRLFHEELAEALELKLFAEEPGERIGAD